MAGGAVPETAPVLPAPTPSAVPSPMSPDAAGTRSFPVSASPTAPHRASASEAHPTCSSDPVTGTVHTGSVNGDGGGHVVMRTVHAVSVDGEHGIDADTGTVPTGSGDGEGACASGVPGLSSHASRQKRCARHAGGHRNLVWPRPRDPTQVNSAAGGDFATSLHQPATSEYQPEVSPLVDDLLAASPHTDLFAGGGACVRRQFCADHQRPSSHRPRDRC